MSTRKKASRAARKIADTAVTSGFGIPEPTAPRAPVIPPARVHTASYHWPLLLGDKTAGDALLRWFESIEDVRSMPWRKKWIDPVGYAGNEEELGSTLAKRAYEVWVSEIMLQQTRVSTVVPYFKSWIAKWPTVEDLARAEHDEVLSVWKGLGYYSRATRLHQGAKDMVARSGEGACPIPSKKGELEKFSGIGPYTAGAISSIAFGESEAVLDGNVARVLSRQLGLYADAKDKKTTDLFWNVADRLVKHVSGFPGTERSAVPGQWNQALMELGSTVCTPRPKCEECPIQRTCRAYAEGQAYPDKSKMASSVVDIEDACSYCDHLDAEDLAGVLEDEEEKATKKRKRTTKTSNPISQYFSVSTPAKSDTDSDDNKSVQGNGSKKRKAPEPLGESNSVALYCSLFPKRTAKKQASEEECVVCIVELRVPGAASRWLIEQRPAKGTITRRSHRTNTSH